MIEKVKAAVCIVYGITDEQLHSKSREREIINARRMFYYIARKNFNITYKAIGEIFKQDHATVIHHERLLKSFLTFDPLEIDNYNKVVKIVFGEVTFDDIQDELDNSLREQILIENKISDLRKEIKMRFNYKLLI